MDDMLIKHILDSLSIQHLVSGTKILDIGTGAGWPGVPLALVNTESDFFLLDSNNKKILAYNLSHYGNEYNSYINNLSGELDKDINLLIDTIHSSLKYDLVSSNSISKFLGNIFLARLKCCLAKISVGAISAT